jgi:hypothetical protein
MSKDPRGKPRVAYRTTTVRVPNPCLDEVRNIVKEFKDSKTDRLSDFTCGYICALSSYVHSEGVDTMAIELWEEIGRPTAAQAKKAELSEYDIEALEKCEEYRRK